MTGNLSGNLTVDIRLEEETAVYTPPIPSYILQAREAYMNAIKQTQMNIMHSSRNNNIGIPPITNTTSATTTTTLGSTTNTNNTAYITQSSAVAVAVTSPLQHTDVEHEPYLSSLPASFRLDILILFVIQG